MKRIILIISLLIITCCGAMAQDDYYIRQARKYQLEAEYYQKRSRSYRIDAEYYRKRAKSVQTDAEYYSRNGNYDKAARCNKHAAELLEKYRDYISYALKADEKAATYLKWAAEALAKR